MVILHEGRGLVYTPSGVQEVRHVAGPRDVKRGWYGRVVETRAASGGPAQVTLENGRRFEVRADDDDLPPARTVDPDRREEERRERCERVVRNSDFAALPGALRCTHINLYDQTVEGLQLDGKPVFSVQYHPEASPGPQDSFYLFEKFVGAMK